MLRFALGLFLLSSCSLGVISTGGDRTYVYDVHSTYTSENLVALAPQVVTTSQRDPYKGKLDELFSKDMPPIKRIGIISFETMIQQTRSGLAGDDKVYLSAAGKQLLTEKLLSLWEQSLPILGEGVEYVRVSKIKKSKNYKLDGIDVVDHVLTKRDALMPDDIFYREKGKETTMFTVMNPRGMRDLSLAAVPAAELMSGPKFSEHAKHTLNEVAKELKLDAMLVVWSDLHWTAAHIDKHSGEIIPEEVVVNINASTLVPFSNYQRRMEKLGQTRDLPSSTVAYRAYEAKLKIPVYISVPPEDQTFDYIEKELLSPALKTYNDMAQMVQTRIISDIKLTHK